jgi:hypothetical protein
MCECPLMYDERIVTARKPHHCCECGATIAKGERYQSASGMWEGRFGRFHTCLPCVETREKATEGIKPGDCCDLPALGELRQYLADGFPWTKELYEPVHARFLLATGSQVQYSGEPT